MGCVHGPLISHVCCPTPKKKKHYFKRYSYFIRLKLCGIVLTSTQKTFDECRGHVTRHELNRSFMVPHTFVHGIMHLQTRWNYGNLSVKVSRTIVESMSRRVVTLFLVCRSFYMILDSRYLSHHFWHVKVCVLGLWKCSDNFYIILTLFLVRKITKLKD